MKSCRVLGTRKMSLFGKKEKKGSFLNPIDVQTDPRDFNGRIFHLLGQGLGDTVNAFRIVFALQSLFPQSNHVLYCDQRWRELLPPGTSWTVHWYPEALDPRHPERGVVSPYQESLREILSVAGTNDRLGYFSYLLPDQLARGESTQETIARKLGLSDVLSEFRPLVHVSPSDWEKADKILEQHGLEKGRFFTMAPHTWPDKSWRIENFEELGKKVWEEFGAKSVILGLPELKTPTFEGAVPVFGIPLPVVAAIIAWSRLFIGLDSGLSHVAAGFDLPLIVLYCQGKIPAFEIRVHSPYAEYILEQAAGRMIEVKIVLDILRFHMKRSFQSVNPPVCPACGRTMQYVTQASEDGLNRRCFCGTHFLDKRDGLAPKTKTHEEAETGKANEMHSSDNPKKTIDHTVNQSFWKDVEYLENQRWSKRISFKNVFPRLFMTEVGDPFAQTFSFSMDGIFFFLRRSGYQILSVIPEETFERKKEFTLRIEFSKEHLPTERILIPWGKGTLFLKYMEDYFTYFSWQSWATPIRWTSLSKRIYEWGKKEDAVRVARIIFWMDPSVKTAKYWLRYFFLSIWDLWKSRWIP
jgi:hypothetical protein